jgi:cytochrome c oxidase cbb3-type subunit 2
MFERKSGILLIAGLIFFAFAFLSNAVVPALMYSDIPEKTAEELVNGNIRYQFEDLSRRYPESFVEAFGEPPADAATSAEWWNQNVADALREGRDIYVGEGCWHCHSQFIRPVSNEEQRWGPVSASWEYQNELQRPVLFGTRRVGPDLSREGGRRSNDWHAVHLFKPTMVSWKSPMPEYPWFFDGDPSKPNRRGLVLMTYVQWLGSWLKSYPDYDSSKAEPLDDPTADAAAADETEAAAETETAEAAE